VRLYSLCAILLIALGAWAGAAHRDVSPHFQAAWDLEQKGQVDQAIAEYRKAIEETPDHADSHYNLGRLLAGKGDYDGAIVQFREALRTRPDDADSHNNLGLVLKNKGALDDAAREYRTALRLNPKHADAHINLGNVFYLRKDLKEAIQQYRAAIEAQPAMAVPHVSLGNALDDSGQTDAAIQEFKEAIRLDPSNAQAHYNLAICLAKRQDTRGTMAELREAARLAPGWPTPQIQLVQLLMGSDRQAASEQCRMALLLTQDGTLRQLCSRLYASSDTAPSGRGNQYPREVALGAIAGQSSQESPPPGTRSTAKPVGQVNTAPSASSNELFKKGSVFFLQRDYRNASVYYQQALDLEKQKPALQHNLWRVLIDNLAMSYGIPGDLEHAQETLEYGVSKDPTYPNFYYTMACVYAEMNDLDHTLSNLRTAFKYKNNVIAGEQLPDPRSDDSFQRFKSDERFQKLIASLPLR
jgi:tetratricopeptide (TPR) repeat protein